MPKYSNGRDAKVGDRVFFKDRIGKLHLGKITAIEKGDTLRVLPFTDAQPVQSGECIHADDHNGGAPKAPAATEPEPDADEIKRWGEYQFSLESIQKMVKRGEVSLPRAVKLETAQGDKARRDIIAGLTESNGG